MMRLPSVTTCSAQSAAQLKSAPSSLSLSSSRKGTSCVCVQGREEEGSMARHTWVVMCAWCWVGGSLPVSELLLSQPHHHLVHTPTPLCL